MADVISKTLVAKDGRKVTLRPIRWDDLDDCLEFINSLVDEESDIYVATKVSRDEEAEWLGKRLASIEKGELADVIAEIDGKMIANAEVGRRRGIMNHVGDLGIGIRAGYRGIGVGTMLMNTLVEESRKMGLKMLVLDVFDTNKIAQGLYRKIGFRENGRIPKGIFKKGEYIDLARMTLEL